MVLFTLIEALQQIGGMAVADAITGPAGPKLTHLDVEIEELARLLEPYDLRVTVKDRAREAIMALELDKAGTKGYVHERIREPLSRMIQRGEVRHGQRIYVDWSDSVWLSALNTD
jgi:hypothetical protein